MRYQRHDQNINRARQQPTLNRHRRGKPRQSRLKRLALKLAGLLLPLLLLGGGLLILNFLEVI